MQKPLFVYCYDAYCGWCYGFSPVLEKLFEEFREVMDFEVLSGNMIPKESAKHISATADYISKAYKQVEETTGVKFGEDWVWHYVNPDKSDWYPSSEKPAIALCIIKDLHPDLAVPFAADLQKALHLEGRDLTDDEAYRHLLPKYGMEADDFYAKLHSAEYAEKANYDFALCRQLKVTGFPAAYIQTSDNKFYQVLRGYADYDTMKLRIENVFKETGLTAADQAE